MAEESPVDFGSMMRQARERKGVSLQQVASVTKISARVLGALERNDPTKLPGGIFSRAFVRSYAREIGVDPEVAVAQFATAFPQASGAEELPRTKDAEEIEAFESSRQIATTVMQVIGISVLVLVAILVLYNMKVGRKPAPPPPAAPVAAPTQAPPPVAAQPSAAPDESQVQGGTDPSRPAHPSTDQDAATTGAAVGASDATQPAPAAMEITLVSRGPCWLLVKLDGNVVLSRTLESGERLAYPVRTAVMLSVGNAGLLDLTINGKAAKPLGVRGQVVTVNITPETAAAFLQ